MIYMIHDCKIDKNIEKVVDNQSNKDNSNINTI